MLDIVPSGVEPFDGQRNYVDTSNVELASIVGELDKVTFEKRPSRANMEAGVGDVLYAKMASQRKVLLVDAPNTSNIYSTGFFVLRPKAGALLSKYLYYWLRWEGTEGLKDRISHGETQRQLSNTQFRRKFKIPLPKNREDQAGLIAKLDRADAVLSSLIQQEERAKSLLANERERLFGQVDPSDFCPLSSVLKFPPYRYPTFYGFQYVEKGVPVLKISNMTLDGKFPTDERSYDHISEEVNLRFPRTVVDAGDLVLEVRGTYIGKTALVPEELSGSNISPNTMRLAPDPKAILPRFLWHYTFTPDWTRQVQKGVRNWKLKFGTIKSGKIKSLRIPKPDLTVQAEAIERLDALDSILSRFSEDTQNCLRLLQTLMTKLFYTVPPNDFGQPEEQLKPNDN